MHIIYIYIVQRAIHILLRIEWERKNEKKGLRAPTIITNKYKNNLHIHLKTLSDQS